MSQSKGKGRKVRFGPKRRWRKGGREVLRRAILEQVRAAHAGADIAQRMVEGEVSPAVARREIAAVERRGDDERATLIAGLSNTLVTPVDREDLFRLSRSIDSVLDTIQDFLREVDLYGVQSMSMFRELVSKCLDAIILLEEAIEYLWIAPEKVPMKALAGRKAAGLVSQAYRNEFATMFSEPDVRHGGISERELIKRLDWVGIRIREAADALTDGVLKRGY